MWTKNYIFNPTAEQYFKTKHPIATSSVLMPLCVYYLYIKLAGINSWWLLIGMVGCLALGVGLAYLFAVVKKIYAKVWLPALAMVVGSIFITVSLIMAQ